MKTNTVKETPHNIYKFKLHTDAEIFYRQCQEVIRNPYRNKKTGILTIKGNEVVSPEWIDIFPMSDSLVERSGMSL